MSNYVIDMAGNEAVTIITTETRNLRALPFRITEDQLSTGKEWEDWLEAIEREFRYFKISNPVDKKDALIIYGGKEIARLEKSLPDPTGNLNEYENLRTKLNDYFMPKRNKHYSRYIFLKMRPIAGETTITYATRLREKAQECEFGDTCDERILEHLIQTIENESLIQRCISKGWNLSQFLTEAGQIEDISLQMRDMKDVSHEKQIARIDKNNRQEWKQRSSYRKVDTDIQPCGYCGLRRVHPDRRNCPAYGKTCNKCQRPNHFAAVCRADRYRNSMDKNRYDTKRGRNQVKKTSERESDSGDTSDEEFLSQSIAHMRIKRVNKRYSLDKTVPLMINDILVRAEPDSGADVNVMDEFQFRALKHRSTADLELQRSRIKLMTLQNELPIKGEFKAIIRNKTCGIQSRFLVVKGRINSPPLISKATLTELGMLQIRDDGYFAEPNDLRMPNTELHVNTVNEDPSAKQEIAKLLDKHANVFEGIGRIRDIKNDTELYVKFNMNPEAAPVAQKPRPVAYHLQKPLKLWLEQSISEGIFEEVPSGEPVTWCSPMVVQPKPRFVNIPKDELQPNMIRACVDLRIPNKYMERNRITQGPIVEDFMYKFHDCVKFSKLDLRSGYHQLSLHPESRSISTFSTPWGNLRPKRLIFGAKASQDLFDEMMYRIFGDIPNCMNQRDDILIGGRNIKEHNKTLQAVLQRAEDFGITFNRDKCEFGVEEIEFFGYKFTKDGLKPTLGKVKAVKDSKRPETKEAVRSFLGMVGYLSKFIDKYASITAPLRKLTEKDVKFKWGPDEQSAFNKLKDSITSEKTMIYFNPKRKIVVRTEASYNDGLSAGLFQNAGNGLQPVHFISRTMTNTEKRYSQTEKDALAVRWAKNRFGIYLLGAPRFKIVTAHKPLLPMFNKATAKLPPRIERWVMDMQDVDFEMVYEPGKDEADPLDFLSRHPLPVTGTDDTEKVVKSILVAEHAIVLDRIKMETMKDEQLQKLHQRIVSEDWERHRKDKDISQFYSIRHELYVMDGLIFRLNQIVIPSCLQRKVIKAAHSLGHLGMTKTKQMLREKYWFPEMNKMTEVLVGQCYECQLTTKQHRQEPVKMTNIPQNPWEVVSVDFGGPYPDGHYNLVVIDKRTRYPEVEVVYSTGIKPTKEKLKKIFATHGTPVQLESDNGPPFTSKEFAEFAATEGFKHHRITPLHPRANGEAESFMKLVNKTEQRAQIQRTPTKLAMQEMLTGYRSTPHPATGVTPYEGMMNRRVRTKLDYESRRKEQLHTDKKLINERDRLYKERVKQNAENRNTKKHNFKVGDQVLLEQAKRNKWSSFYEPDIYIVYRINGSTISARRMRDGREVCRDSSYFRLADVSPEETTTEKETRTGQDDRRENILRKSRTHSSTKRNDLPETETSQMSVAHEENERTESTEELAVVEEEGGNRGEQLRRSGRTKRRPRRFDDYVTDWN